MFIFVCRPSSTSIGIIRRVLQAPVNAIDAFMKKAPAVTFWVYQRAIQEVFDIEGDPQWAPLAVSTIQNRLRAGFPPEHPILERTGAFRRAFVVAGAPGNVIDETNYGMYGKTIRFGISDPRFIWHQEGTRFMPARPIVPNTPSKRQTLGLMMEEELVPLMNVCVREVSR